MPELKKIFYGRIVKGKTVFKDSAKLVEYLKKIEADTDKSFELIISSDTGKRTDQQNRALHLWFTQLSTALNEGGYDMRAVIREGVDIFWSPFTVKDHLWRPVQKALLGKESTKDLNKDEIDKVFDVINKAVGERCGVHVPFPSWETLTEI